MSKYAAFFVSTEIHKRTVTLADGSEHELYFRELPVSMFRKFQIAEASEDEDVRAGSMAKLIAASLCEADGSPSMTYEQAMNLKPNVSSRLFDQVISLGGVGKGKASPPGEKSGSSTNSPSPLAADQSQSGETPSLEKSSTAGESSTESSHSTTTTAITGPQP
jgi:hypothetical protein